MKTSRPERALQRGRDPLAHPKLDVLDDATRNALSEPLDTLALGETLAELPDDGDAAQRGIIALLNPSGYPDRAVQLKFVSADLPATGTPQIGRNRSVLYLSRPEGALILARGEHGEVLQLLEIDHEYRWNALHTQRDLNLSREGLSYRAVSVGLIDADPEWRGLMPQWLDRVPQALIDPTLWHILGTFLAIQLFVFIPDDLARWLNVLLETVCVLAVFLLMGSVLIINPSTRWSFRVLAARLIEDRTHRLKGNHR